MRTSTIVFRAEENELLKKSSPEVIPMKQLVILCHPDGKSLSKIVWSEIALLYEKYKWETEVRDLYEMKFNPVLSIEDITAHKTGKTSGDVLKEQEYVKNAEIITFVYPIWPTGTPAMIKGYIDRIFSENFAYSFSNKENQKLLKGKKVVLVNVYEHPTSVYNANFDSNVRNILESFGMDIILHYKLENITPDLIQTQLQVKIEDLKIEMKKVLFLKNNSRLSIPTIFF